MQRLSYYIFGIALDKHESVIMSAYHLYRVLRLTGFVKQDWPRMDSLVTLQKKALGWTSSRSVKDYYTRWLLLEEGVSLSSLHSETNNVDACWPMSVA